MLPEKVLEFGFVVLPGFIGFYRVSVLLGGVLEFGLTGLPDFYRVLPSFIGSSFTLVLKRVFFSTLLPFCRGF